MNATTLYLMRHAQSQGNVHFDHGLEPLLETELGTDLSDLGAQQTLSIASDFHLLPVDAIYSSHLTRAKKTASAIANKKKMQVTIHEDLRERLHESENEIDAINRFVSCVNDIVIKNSGKTVLIVSHGFVISSFLRQYKLGPYDKLQVGSIQNTGYVKLNFTNSIYTYLDSKGLPLND